MASSTSRATTRAKDIEGAAERVLTLSSPSYQALKRILQAKAATREARAEPVTLVAEGPHIRAIEEYQRFFDQQATGLASTDSSLPQPQESTR